jgi:hypothetical protein
MLKQAAHTVTRYFCTVMQGITFTDRVIVEAFLALLTAVPIKVVLALTSALSVTRYSN